MTETHRDLWRWKNVPVPEAHVFLALAGVVLGFAWPREIGLPTWLGVAGWSLIVTGALLGAWAVHAAGIMDLEAPSNLVTVGPYAFSRHPMYVGWTLIFAGLVLVLDTWWLVALAPVLSVMVHRETRREEARLAADFGSDYERYRLGVRRYL